MASIDGLKRRLETPIGRRDVLTTVAAGIALGGGLADSGRTVAAQTPAGTPTRAAGSTPAGVTYPEIAGVTHRQIETNGIGLHIAEAGSGPLVILVHGWPEIWYSWRHQLTALADAGYHAVAPDLRGYGDSDAPEPVESYSLRNQIDDILGLIDASGAEQAVLIGHDVGAGVTWACTELHPDRIAAHATIGIPYGPRREAPPVEASREFSGDAFSFLNYFTTPGLGEAELGADPRRSLRLFLYALSGDAPPDLVPYLFTGRPADSGILDGMPEPETLPPWLTEADLDVYAAAYERSGFRGGLNGYRNMDSDWADVPEVGTLGIEQPVLFITGSRDTTLRMVGYELLGVMEESVPNLTKLVLLPGAGHWTQQERADDVNVELIDFLQRGVGLYA